jgi:acid stress chaperone HdeA
MLKSTGYGKTFALSMVVAVAAIGLGSVAHAAKPEKKLDAKKMTCEDFLALGTEEQPRVVYWLDGYSKSGKLEDEDIGVDTFERPVAMVVTECHKAPKDSLMDKIKAYF